MKKDLNSKLYLPVKHHSTGDWDFSSGNWALSPAQFWSPPTSLKCTSGVINVLCNLADAYRRPEGRLVSYIYHGWMGDQSGFIFRCQQPAGSVWLMNRYYASHISPTHWILQSYLGLAPTTVGYWAVPTVLDTWYRYRLTFWISQTEKCEPALFVQLERQENDHWVDYGILEDTANLYAGSSVNRYGICVYGTYAYFDNTELWKPLEV